MSDASAHDDGSLESLVGQVADEFLSRQKRGDQPSIEEYAARYPHAAGLLRNVLTSLRLIEQSSEGEARSLPLGDAGPAETLGDFRIVREVGRGGMGVVYETEQLSLGRRVALKVLPFAAALDARQLRRFKNEAQAAAHLRHPHIVPVYAVGCERGLHYYAMQLIDGRSLAELIAELRSDDKATAADAEVDKVTRWQGSDDKVTRWQGDKVTEEADTHPVTLSLRHRFQTIARLGVQAAEALAHAHREGIIHRDVKPANLLVDTRGDLWVTDFGLARLHNEVGLTLSGDLLGTLRYMSPEQASGNSALIDPRSDVYSLGATLYELLALCPVFDGQDRQALLRQIAGEMPRLLGSAVPVELETIVRKALEKEPASRYGTAQELADDLRRFLEDKPIRARRPSWLEQARRLARRHRPVVWSVAAALLVTLAVVAGCVGWVVRDQAARQARSTQELRTALDQAQLARREGRWPQAQLAGQRVAALIRDGAVEPALAAQVQRLLGELDEEEADRRLIARVEEIRLLQAEVHVKESRFASERAIPEYRLAFGEYGLRADRTAPAEAVALLRRRPPAVRGTLIAALEHWLLLAHQEKAEEIDWLEQVLATADSGPWWRAVRAARCRRDRPALESLAREVEVAAQPPEALLILALVLRQRGATESSVTLLRRAQEAFPDDFWINHNLGMALKNAEPPKLEEAIGFLRVAVALRPRSAGVRLNLGTVLWHSGRLDEAAAAFRRAIALKPDYAAAYHNLGRVLGALDRLDEAVAALRKEVDLTPERAGAHYNLGIVLMKQDRHQEAAAAYRRAIALKPDFAEAHCNLGVALWKQSEFAQALTALQRGHELGSRRPDWPYPSARWVEDCQRLLEEARADRNK
jgi:serine/threonine protein kinase/Flp pilus assembly protein TadD